MTNTSTTQLPQNLTDELNRVALKYNDFTSDASLDTALPESFEKVYSTASNLMTLRFSGMGSAPALHVLKYATNVDGNTTTDDLAAERRKSAKEHNFAWDQADGKWGEGAVDFTNEELAEKLRELLVSDVW